MKNPNLNELAARIHEQNKAAGWWDIPRPRVQTAWLVITELAEATEAERAGKYTNMAAFETDISDNERVSKEVNGPDSELSLSLMFADSFKRYIKDTFEDEIADAVIRLLDFAGSEDHTEYLVIEPAFRSNKEVSNEEAFFSVTSCLWQCIYALNENHLHASAPYMYGALSMLAELANLRGFDLWQHVELKIKYNATRTKMHGGKKF